MPDPSSSFNIGEFIDRLRALKVWAGNPSFEQLRRRSGVASSTLSDALSARRTTLPSLSTVRGFVRACGGTEDDVARWEVAWRRVQARHTAPVEHHTPHQTPRPASPFIGRIQLLRQLERHSAETLVLLVGAAGAGKSALAAHWSHRVAQRYPDGQLYVDLRGFAAQPTRTSCEALAMPLRALGVADQDIPDDVTCRIALYRSLTYTRRMLIILDDARDAAHAAALIPNGPHCFTIVTSRNRMSALVAGQGGRRFTVPPLGPAEAEALLATMLGGERAAGEPEAVRRLAELCGHLPLALRTAAAHLSDRQHQSIGGYVRQLERTGPLNGLTLPEPSVRAAVNRSYLALDPAARRLLRVLGDLPTQAFTGHEVAATSGLPLNEVVQLLDAIAAMHLIEPVREDGYSINPLIRAFVQEPDRWPANPLRPNGFRRITQPAGDRSRPLVGTPVPAVTSTCSTEPT